MKIASLASTSGRGKRLKQHRGMRFRRRHVCGLNGSKELSPSQRLEGRRNGVRPVPGRDCQHGISGAAQLLKKVVDPVERPFGKSRIGPQPWQETVIGFDHLENGGGRAGELSQNDIERFSNQRQTVGR